MSSWPASEEAGLSFSLPARARHVQGKPAGLPAKEEDPMAFDDGYGKEEDGLEDPARDPIQMAEEEAGREDEREAGEDDRQERIRAGRLRDGGDPMTQLVEDMKDEHGSKPLTEAGETALLSDLAVQKRRLARAIVHSGVMVRHMLDIERELDGVPTTPAEEDRREELEALYGGQLARPWVTEPLHRLASRQAEAGILGTNLLDSEEFRKLRSQACATLARLRVGMRDQAVLVETLSADAAQIEDATAEIRSVMRSLGVKTMREAEMLGASMRAEKGVEDARERLGLEPDEVKEAVGRIGVLAETVRSAIYRYGEHEDEIRADAKDAAEAWAAVRDDREKIARANIRLAFQEAAGYADRGIAVADLTSVANEALAVAIDDYDAGRDGANFETFVRGRIRKALVDTVAGGELDTGARKRVARLNNALRMLMQKDGKEPSDAQLAARLGWDEGRVRSVRREAMRARMSRTVSMDQAIGGEEDGATLMDFIADKSAQREEEARLVDKGGMLPELKDRNRELEKKGTLLKDRLLSPEEIGLDGGAAARRIRDAVKRQREIHDGLGER